MPAITESEALILPPTTYEWAGCVTVSRCGHSGTNRSIITSTMFTVKMDRTESMPLHDQVAAEIRRAIAEGEAGPGERLPLAKDLAAILGVNKNTVLRALHILRDEGLLDFQRGRGITVAGPPSEARSSTGFEISSTTAVTRATVETKSSGSSRDSRETTDCTSEDRRMTLLLEEPTAADEQRAQLLFKEARQRRRRLRFIWIAIVTTVVVSLYQLRPHRSTPGQVRSRDRLRSTRSPGGPPISARGPRSSMPSTTFE